MRRFILSLVFITMPSLAAADQTVDAVKAYAFDTTRGMANGAAYIELANMGPSLASLIGASSDVAEFVQIHHHVMEGDMRAMREVEGPLDMAPGGRLIMAPGGVHVMLLGLRQPLTIGDVFTLTLQLEGSHTRDLDVEVEVFGVQMRDMLIGEQDATEHGEMHGAMDMDAQMQMKLGEEDDTAHAHGSH